MEINDEILLDDETADLLDSIAACETLNIDQMVEIIGRNSTAFREFISAFQLEADTDVQEILRTIEAKELTERQSVQPLIISIPDVEKSIVFEFISELNRDLINAGIEAEVRQARTTFARTVEVVPGKSMPTVAHVMREWVLAHPELDVTVSMGNNEVKIASSMSDQEVIDSVSKLYDDSF
ncbi:MULTISPECIES: hypothetical protein [Nitrosomonas]|uniref:Uncharacterized protein n=1 Tax=Nitrosomonas communis TaxID=44574 RepID=A0A0F7KDA0_9PROT|nr:MULTISPECIES: hypothetical protein [Nitrosomonas]AKH37551.1 hypothetical protein AAW31_06545 [Nitrosomonas communis]TYP78469.1 hypothetical protein BCL69_10721 [Nitrosomonas communis]UVS62811.1 hypothetical protein NX761_06805 [Nitrosomonas sp. PLL12]